MSLFKFRWPTASREGAATESAQALSATENIERMRVRARRRLIGAVALVVMGVVIFPLLFDTESRPVSVDVPILIPDKNKVGVLNGSTLQQPWNASSEGYEPRASASAGSDPASTTSSGAASSGADSSAGTAVRPASPPAASAASSSPESRPAASNSGAPTSAATTPPAPPKPKPASVNPERTDKPPVARASSEQAQNARSREEEQRARALLEGREVVAVASSTPAPPDSVPASDGAGRFIVQVGAYAEASKAQEVRAKLERSGIKTYAQVVRTAEGDRTRVRVGPFANRGEAEKAAARVKALNLPASVLNLQG